VTYDLQSIGPTGFQSLAAALVLAELGARAQVMGSGRDGGRDLYVKGRLNFSAAGQPAETWDGYTVIQIKQKETLSAKPAEDTDWLWRQIRPELELWADPDKNRNPLPDYLLFVTNIPLTPFPAAGGHDKIQASIEGYIEGLADDGPGIATRKEKHRRVSSIKGIRVWDGNQLQTLLNIHEGVRRSVPGFLTGPDVFAALSEFTDRLPVDKLEPALRTHARATLLGEGSVYFDEAGGAPKGVPIYEVATDLPTTNSSGERGTFVRSVLDRAEHVLVPSVTTVAGPRHLVVTGAPGNGKSTISRFLVQAFRAAMLDGSADLGADHKTTIDGMQSALGRFGKGLPKNRRWPMRIDLAEYAEKGGLIDESTLLRWIAQKVTKRADEGEITPAALKSWMKSWPWLLVLDGLDEVTEPATRRRLITQVVEFVNEAEAQDNDLLVVLTTRPIGYTEDIAPNHFERIDLDYLQPAEAVRFGALATKVRLGNDHDRIERVVGHLERSASDDSLRNLLRTPLQVLILTIIVDAAGQLSPDRFRLFWGYYEAVFRREQGKSGWLQRLLNDYEQQIQLLHERVGFELQVRSEAGERSFATLTPDELKNITWQVLDDAGFEPSGKDASLLTNFFNAATQRLILLAPRGDDGYGFDVRSLQEVMAAKYLTAGPLEDSVKYLKIALPNPHWRNTWLFAAGSLFSEPRDHQQQAVVELVEHGDEDAPERLGTVAPVTPRLALEILDDGMARSVPKWRDRLARHGLRVLNEPGASDLPALVRIMVRFADVGDAEQAMVADALRHALAGTAAAQATANQALFLIRPLVDEVGADSRVYGLASVLAAPGVASPAPDPKRWDTFDAEIGTHPGPVDVTARLMSAGQAVQRIAHNASMTARGIEHAFDSEAEAILAALDDPGTATELAAALDTVVGDEPALERVLRDEVLAVVYRRSIGEELRH
jgi:hypothetical protein